MSNAGGVDREGELPGIALGRLSRQACRVSEAMNDTPHFLHTYANHMQSVLSYSTSEHTEKCDIKPGMAYVG